ncbi:hypothetical protein SCG7086_AR_00170 [Chlamydiales bacterium SCGC AG-110-P3]|nr:hypothetical protein SCG7086_AR_00170 [Chlamydiales bacterium SCGC AG-110-P3]
MEITDSNGVQIVTEIPSTGIGYFEWDELAIDRQKGRTLSNILITKSKKYRKFSLMRI